MKYYSFTKREAVSLISICLGSFLIILDTNILNVVMPVIKNELHIDYTAMAWVSNSYILTFAGLLLLLSTFAKRIGSKNAFLLGISVFLAGSIFAGFANSYFWLIAGRIVQGVGAALFSPVATLLLNQLFPDVKKKAAAFAIWSGTSGIAFAFSPIIGGLLSYTFGYRSVFFINIPFVIIIILFGIYTLPNNAKEQTQFHFKEQIYFIIGLLAFVLFLSFIDIFSVAYTILISLLFIAIVFRFIHQIRKDKLHILPADLFNIQSISSLLSVFSYNLCCYGFMLALSILYQNQLGYNSTLTGVLFLPFTLSAMLLTTFLSPKISEKFGLYKGQRYSLISMIIGLILVCISMLYRDYYYLLSIGYVFLGFSGMVAPLVTNAIYQDTNPEYHNEISSFLNIFRQFGSMIGIILATISINYFGIINGIYVVSFLMVILLVIAITLSKTKHRAQY